MEEGGPLVAESREAEMPAAPLRAGVIGAGFHRPGPRSVGPGRRARPSRGSSPPRRSAAPRSARSSARAGSSPGAEELIASDEVDVVHVCAPNDLHLPSPAPPSRPGKHVVCEKPVALDSAGADGARGGRARCRGGSRRCRSPTATTRSSARPGRGCAPGGIGDARLVHGTYLQDWLLGARRRQLAGRRRDRRALARVRRHRGPLVRSRRVRDGAAHRRPSRRGR